MVCVVRLRPQLDFPCLVQMEVFCVLEWPPVLLFLIHSLNLLGKGPGGDWKGRRGDVLGSDMGQMTFFLLYAYMNM